MGLVNGVSDLNPYEKTEKEVSSDETSHVVLEESEELDRGLDSDLDSEYKEEEDEESGELEELEEDEEDELEEEEDISIGEDDFTLQGFLEDETDLFESDNLLNFDTDEIDLARLERITSSFSGDHYFYGKGFTIFDLIAGDETETLKVLTSIFDTNDISELANNLQERINYFDLPEIAKKIDSLPINGKTLVTRIREVAKLVSNLDTILNNYGLLTTTPNISSVKDLLKFPAQVGRGSGGAIATNNPIQNEIIVVNAKDNIVRFRTRNEKSYANKQPYFALIQNILNDLKNALSVAAFPYTARDRAALDDSVEELYQQANSNSTLMGTLDELFLSTSLLKRHKVLLDYWLCDQDVQNRNTPFLNALGKGTKASIERTLKTLRLIEREDGLTFYNFITGDMKGENGNDNQ